jgi:uncharacterized protein with NRDE domain
MCSILLRIAENGVEIAANRDELLSRPWLPPAAHWPGRPGIIAGRDQTAGGTWMGLNAHGVMAAVLNRHGALGPAPGKRSRGELPLLALEAETAEAAAARIAALDPAAYRSFNLVTADATGAYLVRGLGHGTADLGKLPPGVTMITAGEPNDAAEPRIARHLPKFRAAAWDQWQTLLTDDTGPRTSALNIPAASDGFGTVCASLVALPRDAAPEWRFATIAPERSEFGRIF